MKKILLSILLTALFCGVMGFAEGGRTESVALADDVYDFFTEEHVLFYEKEIAKRPVVSNINPSILQSTALKYDITVDKLKKVLVFQHAMSQCGGEYTVQELLDMDSSRIVRCAKAYIEYLKKTMSEEELQALAEKFKKIKQN